MVTGMARASLRECTARWEESSVRRDCHPPVLPSAERVEARPICRLGRSTPAPSGAVQSRGGGCLRNYEIMLILPAEADEQVVSGVVDRVSRTLADTGGKVGKID